MVSIKDRLHESDNLKKQVAGLSKHNYKLQDRNSKLNKVLGDILKDISDERPDLVLKYLDVYNDKENA